MLQKGKVLNNRYQIQAILGEGGFGAVYKAWDDNLQKYSAIKENLQVSLEAQKQFKREAIMLANLIHPHLVRVTDYFLIANHGQYLVMDYVDGYDLGTVLAKNGKPLPVEQSLVWINQVCEALIYIHSQNPPIIHRDIKPQNIRITSQGNAILVDFGLAKVLGGGVKTTMGARGLTPHFAAPEQYGFGGTNVQSDVYSLGVTLYCMLTCQVPADSLEILLGNATSPPLAKVINPNVPDLVNDALLNAMQIRQVERLQSVLDFKKMLKVEIERDGRSFDATAFQKQLRILIVDDSDIIRKKYFEFLENVQDLLVVGEANNGRDAIDLLDTLRPDIVLMDTHMPVLDGISATELIVQKQTGVNVIICSIHDNPEIIRRAKKAGAKDYLLIPFDKIELINAIRR